MKDYPSNPPNRIQSPAPHAGGLGAVFNSMKYLARLSNFSKSFKTLFKMNQKKGFDCPGCAWPDPEDDRSTFEFCENGAKALAEEISKQTIGADFFKKNSIPSLRDNNDYELSLHGRISEPLIKREGEKHYSRVTWDEAFELISRNIISLPHADAAVFYTSGRTSNEAAFLYQLMVRKIGTNNLPDCSNMCHESSGVAMKESIGIGKGTVLLSDFEKTDLVLIIGQNPGTNHPRMLTTLKAAKKSGSKIVTINPLFEAGSKKFKHPQHFSDVVGSGTELSDLHIPVKVNGDQALFQAIAKEIIENRRDFLDLNFIRKFSHGFEDYEVFLKSLNKNDLLIQAEISEELFHNLISVISESKSIIACWAMGLTQHKNAVATIQEVMNFLFLGGNIGKPGAGACPVRGHSNVQGDRTMGIWEAPSKEFLDSLEHTFDFKMPRSPGYSVVHALEAMKAGKVNFFMAMGGNLLSAGPDTEVIKNAFENTDLTVHVSTKLNRSHLYPGKTSLILPCLARSERDIQKTGPQKVSVENSMGIVHSSEGGLHPCSDLLKSEVSIICEMADIIFSDNHPDWISFKNDYSLIRDKIESTIPEFDKFNERFENTFTLPNSPRDSRTFNTNTGKANFIINHLESVELSKNELLLMTVRSHDQYNTTLYGLDDRYRGIFGGRKVLFMNEQDMDSLGFSTGDLVDIKSNYNGLERKVHGFRLTKYMIPQKCVAAYFPETNPLIPLTESAHKSHTPISKSLKVTLERARGSG